jgi:4-amino-4-deoxy-L-arabinose transferase-like glycosyltransferase
MSMFHAAAASRGATALPTAHSGSERRTSVTALVVQYYWPIAIGVLLLAAFNLTFRLGREIVVEWDESLYGVSAWEMFQNRDWIGTTFRKSLDYYNTKPPLNIWLISLSFRAFGTNLVSLRLPSIAGAWLTVLVLQLWVRRAVGPSVALVASAVLATSFGFLYDHSARNANTDALFALLVLLTVVTQWAADGRAWRLLWLGPIAAATFLLRGMGVLMPLAIVAVVELLRQRPWRERVWPMIGAAILFLLPVGAWMWKRWQLDQWQFLGPLFLYDFVARSLKTIEGHSGTPFYHLNILQKNQFDWLAAGLVSFALFPVRWTVVRRWFCFWRGPDIFHVVVGTWITITLLMPALIRTKLSWYLNPFYPAFALLIGALFIHGLSDQTARDSRRRIALAVTIAVALIVAESRLIWYSVHRRSLTQSTQGFLLSEREHLSGQRVFTRHWTNSELFILDALVGAEAREASTVEGFLRESRPGDYWLTRRESNTPELTFISDWRLERLYRRK